MKGIPIGGTEMESMGIIHRFGNVSGLKHN